MTRRIARLTPERLVLQRQYQRDYQARRWADDRALRAYMAERGWRYSWRKTCFVPARKVTR